MTAAVIEEFSAQAAPELLAALREIATREQRPFQSVLDEALRDYLDRHPTAGARRHVTAALDASIAEYVDLYRKLAR